MSDTPTEYFGPHAKRWTNPRTGVTLSLSPRDYYREVAKEQLQREKEVEARYDRTTAETMHAKQLTAETMEPGWPNVISMDTLHERDLEPYAGYFKHPGNVVSPPASTRPTTPAEISAPSSLISDGDGYRKITEAETRTIAHWWGANPPAAHFEIDADSLKLLSGGTMRYASLVKDDTFGSIHPVEQAAPGKAKARHRKPRRSARNTLRLGLLYIIVIIGVISLAEVMF